MKPDISRIFQRKRSQSDSVARTFSRIKSITCPCCHHTLSLNPHTKVWSCDTCAYCISQTALLHGYTYWFCDKCNTFLNVQPGFNTERLEWTCLICNHKNDVSADNILE